MQSRIIVDLRSRGNITLLTGSIGFDASKLAYRYHELGTGTQGTGAVLTLTPGNGQIGFQVRSTTPFPSGVQNIFLVTFDVIGGPGGLRSDNYTELPIQGTPTAFAAFDAAGRQVNPSNLGAHGALIDLTSGASQNAEIYDQSPVGTPVILPGPGTLIIQPPPPPPYGDPRQNPDAGTQVIAPAPTPTPITITRDPGGGTVVGHNPIGTPAPTPGGGITPPPAGTVTGSGQIIAGIPNTYLLIGAAAAIFLMSSK